MRPPPRTLRPCSTFITLLTLIRTAQAGPDSQCTVSLANCSKVALRDSPTIFTYCKPFSWFLKALNSRIYLRFSVDSPLCCFQKMVVFARNNEIPSYLEGRCLAHGGESPSTLVPFPVATAHPLFLTPLTPFPPLEPIPCYNDDINNYGLLVWNNNL